MFLSALLVCLVSFSAHAETVVNGSELGTPVSGVVLDAAGQPVVGAFVLQKGTSNGTVTDLDGQFAIDVPSDAVLEISSMGYVSQEIAVAGKSFFNVVLAEDTQLLEEVVVVGYGTTKKENLTGAVSVVSSESIAKRSRSNLGQILQGTVPGMTVTTSSGQPGEGVSLNIRGWNSINQVLHSYSLTVS